MKSGNWKIEKRRRTRAAFTLFEVVLTLLILGIAAAVVVPAVGNNTFSPRLKTSANVLASDIEYCASECIGNPSAPRAIVFDTTHNKYTLTVFSTGVAIKHPADSMDFVNDFATGRNNAFTGVVLTSATCAGANLSALTFDSYGKPIASADVIITLTYNGTSMTVTVNSSTGDVSIAGG